MSANDYEILTLAFADAKVPEFKKVSGKKWLYYGEEDNFPEYLLMLFNKSAKHGAIVNNKVTYIFGGGLKPETETSQADEFLKKANPNQSWNDLGKQTITDIEVFGGFYWQVIPNLLGQRYVYLLPFSKVRVSPCGGFYYFKNNWKDNKEDLKEFPAFSEKSLETSVFHYKEYRPSADNRYPLPCYMNGLNYIEADVEVSKHTLTNAKNGFSASKMVNLFNGEPDEEKKKAISRRMKQAFTGSEGEKVMITYNNKGADAPTVVDLGTSDLTKEDFTAQDNLITHNIFAGHQVTSPTLFGIQEPGKLGTVSELRTAYDIFKNTYAAAKQKQFCDIVNYFAELNGVALKFMLEPVDPIGFEFTENIMLKVAPKSWLQEKMGIDSTKYTDAPVESAAGPAAPAQEGMATDAPVNEHLRNLTGKQMQGYERIKRKYKNGQMTKEEATVFLKSYGLSDEDIEIALGESQQFAATEDEVCLAFDSHGESREGWDILESKTLKLGEDIDDQVLAMQFGLWDRIKKAVPKFQIRYSYEKRSGVDGPIVKPTTRPFCKKLVSLDRFYSREDIQKISAMVGYNVFERAGGFWNHNGKVDKQCRHEWKANIVIRKP